MRLGRMYYLDDVSLVEFERKEFIQQNSLLQIGEHCPCSTVVLQNYDVVHHGLFEGGFAVRKRIHVIYNAPSRIIIKLQCVENS